jgi:hypothetical protein
MENGGAGVAVVGHQRSESEKHAEDIKKYLELSDSRFIPEVILSVRSPVDLVTAQGTIAPDELGLGQTVLGVQSRADSLIRISRKHSSPTLRIQRVRVARNQLEAIKHDKLVRRIDGNHRLHLAQQLTDDPNTPTKYLAPFCMILLGSPAGDADDFAESLIFHTINSTALPLESEHGLQLLLGQNPTHAMLPDQEFAYNPELHLTRLLSDRLEGMAAPTREKFGDQPLTALWESGGNLIAMDTTIVQDRPALATFAENLFRLVRLLLLRLRR